MGKVCAQTHKRENVAHTIKWTMKSFKLFFSKAEFFILSDLVMSYVTRGSGRKNKRPISHILCLFVFSFKERVNEF